MDGMMWKLCVALLLLSSQQVSHAQNLVNLVQPMVTDMAPTRDSYERTLFSWELFDHDKTTSVELKRSKVVTNPNPWTNWGKFTVKWAPTLPYTIRPTHYRIVLPADLDPADAPTSWSVWILERDVDGSGDPILNSFEGKVTNAVFTNGVYEAALPVVTDLQRFYFQLWDDSARIAEIELLGPRESLNALWPYGDYPCDQRLQVLTSLNGPEKVFSKSGNKVTPNQRRKVFRISSWDGGFIGATFEYDGHKPVLVGAELPDGPMVQEVIIHASYPRRYGLQKVVLQGNFCSPKCDRFGSKGWVRLAVSKTKNFGTPDYDADGLRLYIKNPDVYKAYRLKMVPLRSIKSPVTYLNDVLFLGCKA